MREVNLYSDIVGCPETRWRHAHAHMHMREDGGGGVHVQGSDSPLWASGEQGGKVGDRTGRTRRTTTTILLESQFVLLLQKRR